MKRFSQIILLLFISQSIIADTSVFLSNDTEAEIKYSISVKKTKGLGSQLKKDKHFKILGNTVKPYAIAEALSFNRSQLPAFTSYKFTIHGDFYSNGKKVSNKSFDLFVDLKSLLGTSSVAYGTGGYMYSGKPLRKPGMSPVSKKQKIIMINYKHIDIVFYDFPAGLSFKNGLFNDIEFAFAHTPLTPKPENDKNILNIATYNTFMRPKIAFPHDGQSTRSQVVIPELLVHSDKLFDVICINEAFEKAALNNIKKSAKDAGFVHQSPILGAKADRIDKMAINAVTELFKKKANQKYPELTNGGVVILSRFPIEETQEVLFGKNLCAGSNCLAAKGCMYARINKNGKKYHIFATHTDANDLNIALKQLEIIRKFIDSLKIPATEPVFIAGDMNICKIDPDYKGKHDKMLEILNVEPVNSIGYPHTLDRQTNYFSEADRKKADHVLDYIFFAKDHEIPKSHYNKPVLLKITLSKPWARNTKHKYFHAKRDISDHYPVFGRFEFAN